MFVDYYSEVDSDGDEMPDDDEEAKQFYGYRVWYSLEIHVKPAPPERVLEVNCACQVIYCCIRAYMQQRCQDGVEVYSYVLTKYTNKHFGNICTS